MPAHEYQDHDNEGPEIQPAILQQLQHHAMVHVPFDFLESLRLVGGNTIVMFKTLENIDQHILPGPIVVHMERAGGGIR